MKLRRVVVVYKKSSYDLYARRRKDPHFLASLRRKDPVIARFITGHETHYRSLEIVREILKSRGIKARFTYRADAFSANRADLVLTVGGDGTFMEAARRVRHTPILGLNSNPDDSVGMYCGVRASNLESTLDRLESGTLEKINLSRLAVRIGGKKFPAYVLNDVLIAHANPATTSKYFLEFRGKKEEQKSSGIWVATAAGSTAAISGAGGARLPIRSKMLQFAVRELYVAPGNKALIRRGKIRPTEQLIIRSKMRNGRIYFDGPHISAPFQIGQKLQVTADAPPLTVYAFNHRRRESFR